MLCRAVSLGQSGGELRFPGDEFESKECPSWAEPVNGELVAKEDDYDPSVDINRDSRIINAVNQLDHDNDDHWTGEGNPRMSAVEELAGFDVKSAEVKALCPGVVREQ